MDSKKGITLVILLVALTVMVVIISTSTIIGINSVNSANFEEFKCALNRVSDNVNEYILSNKKLPITNEVVSGVSISDEFLNNVNENSDENNKLYVVDINLLNNDTIRNGRGSVLNKDVYVVSENTNNIYYLKGFKYKGKMFYGN